MIEKLVKTIELENGLKLDIYDKSRMVGADTWLVTVLFRIEIRVDETLLGVVDNAPETGAVVEKTGETVLFEIQRERNFINELEKADVFQAVMDSYLATTLSYLSHPMFGARYVLKTYHEQAKYSA